MNIPAAYQVTAPRVPAEDRSGRVGQRLLRLLSIQAEQGLRWLQETSRQVGVRDREFAIPSGQGLEWPLHMLYQAATNAYVFAALARFGEPGRTMGGGSRRQLERAAVALIQAVIETHPVSESSRARAEWWDKGFTLRTDHLFGMGAWLLWDILSDPTQLLVARILEHDADLYNQDQAPALLYDDTQGESNAWTASGLALAYCLLKQHPRRALWGRKAREFMVTAYATEKDVVSERLVDGQPLNQWLRAPNAFPDYTVENHGFIHPIYMAAVSEMVRTAVCYRLAGEPAPEAATFNADHVLDALIRFNLPDGNHHYPQGTDYDPRRLDSFLQACNVIPLKPNPLREACFLRVLQSMETMARERPDMHLSGDLMFAFDFGTSWGLIENYLMRRLFGSPEQAVPRERIEAEIAGVYVNEPAKFVIHRTPLTLSSFSWHAIERASQVMGYTIPLDRDVLCCPNPCDGYIGHVAEIPPGPAIPDQVSDHQVQVSDDGFSVLAQLRRCAGKVRQHCAFVSLPDGRSVYLEQRWAIQPVTLAAVESGTVHLYDDLRWPFQNKARTFHSTSGVLQPAPGRVYPGCWINVDERMGYAALGLEHFTLARSMERYHTWRLSFLLPATPDDPRRFEAGHMISSFALVSCPHQGRSETELLAHELAERGWRSHDPDGLALIVSPYLVYANFSNRTANCLVNGTGVEMSPRTSGWITTDQGR